VLAARVPVLGNFLGGMHTPFCGNIGQCHADTAGMGSPVTWLHLLLADCLW
jgi:hypothetical protein